MVAQDIDYVELIAHIKGYKFPKNRCKRLKENDALNMIEPTFGKIIYVNLCRMIWDHLYCDDKEFLSEKNDTPYHSEDFFTPQTSKKMHGIMNILKVLYPDIIEDYTVKFKNACK
jgi:hypothetical protein